jgi:histidinol-phosphatase
VQHRRGSDCSRFATMDIRNEDLALALQLADAADAITMDRFRSTDLIVETKPDMTPVSDADRAVELAIREALEERRPQDAVHGEEFGSSEGERQWIIDPIDGTKNFVRGVPVWATLIALRDGDAISVGVVSAPALGRRWWAGATTGAFASAPGSSSEPSPLRVSKVTALQDASFSFSDPVGWPTDALDRLLTSTWRQRAYGDFWSHLMVAEGAVDIAAEPLLKIHDVAALVPIIEAAGGMITTFSGAPLPWHDPHAEFPALTTNAVLHDSVVHLIS